MVRNEMSARTSTASDILTVLYDGAPRVIKAKSVSDQDASLLVEAARPMSGRRRDSYHMAMHRQWYVNCLYYAGIQSLDLPEVYMDVDPGILMQNGTYIANHIIRLVSGNVSRLSSAKTEWSVIPNTPDQMDQDGAKVGQHLLDYAWEYLMLQHKRMELNLILDVMGTGFLYTGWDKTKGEVSKFYFDPLTMQPVAPGQMGQEQLQLLEMLGAHEEKAQGDWDCETVMPFDVFTPIGFKELARMPWVLIRRRMSVDEMWDRYPDTAKNVDTTSSGQREHIQYGRRLGTLTTRPGSSLITGGSIDDDIMVVDELWYAPSARLPDGFYCAMAYDTVLEKGPHPLKAAKLDMRFPIVDFHNIRVPGRFHSMSTVEHLIGPQTEYNRARQQMIQQRDVLAVPQWLAPIGCLAKGAIRNEAGDIWEYNHRIGTPTLVNPPSMPEAVIVTGQHAVNDLQMIAAQSEASLGQNPQGVRSGQALMALQEKDAMAIGPAVMCAETSWTMCGSNLLKLAHSFMSIPRAIAIYGEARQSDIRYFKGKDLNGNTRVWIKPGSMTPKSKAATAELMLQMGANGMLNPADPREKRLMLETLEIGGVDRLFFLEDAARRRARIENLMFSKPDPSPDFAFPDVTQWDDHQAHYEEHLAFLYTDEYERLDPMLKLMFQAHIQKHINAIAQMLEAQMALSQAGGQGAGTGSPEAKPLGKPSPPRQNADQTQRATANMS